ncbi:hypothetical protein C8R45DRAFT_1083115 [Mycena sanguinolenta]|nr:hypothetical protein C8R45DRAFT_1083115 [Mycena sanguinolenta]
MTAIPIIDLSSSRREIIQQIRRACESLGLFYVVKHGIPDEVIQRSLETSAEFFALGDEAKMLLWQEEPVSIHVGYRPSLDSKIDPRGTHDTVEGFTVKWEESGSAESGNKWPEALPGMSDAVMDYYTHGLRLGKQLYQLIALAMGVEENFFEYKTKNNITRLRLLRYPAQTSEVIGSGKHSDFGTFTILLQQPEMEALQVDAPQTGWTFVPPVPGTVVVNLGDQCTICTNGVFRSPIHRVMSRPGPDRYSIPLFFLADFDVVLQPDDSFVTAEHPSQYEPVTAGQHFLKPRYHTRRDGLRALTWLLPAFARPTVELGSAKRHGSDDGLNVGRRRRETVQGVIIRHAGRGRWWWEGRRNVTQANNATTCPNRVLTFEEETQEWCDVEWDGNCRRHWPTRRMPIIVATETTVHRTSDTAYSSLSAQALTPTMHLAWDISELVDLICESSSQASLAALAQTSSLFREPALDVLWREMDSPIPLLKCFPPDSWEISTLDKQPFSFAFIRVIRPDDWDRLALCGRHILPELRKMTWRIGEFPFRHFTSSLGPNATKIAVTLDSNPRYTEKLWNLALRTPPITELTIPRKGYRYSSDDGFEPNLVRRLEHLRRLDIQVFEPPTIDHIATLRDLDTLFLSLHLLPTNIAAPVVPHAFPALRAPKLWANNAVWSIHIINLLRNAPLNQMSLEFGPWLEYTEAEARVAFTNVNDAIRSHCSPSTFTSFRAEYWDWDGRMPAISVDIVRPLCAFYNLRSLVIRAARIDLTDIELRDLVETWSRLECLDLGSGGLVARIQAPPLTLASLSIVAAHCPALVELGLELDVRVIPVPSTSDVAQSNLRTLRVASSSPEVAAYAARIFPRIQTIEAPIR